MTTQSETPLTDAEWAKGGHLGGYRFAKNLERSLTSANQRIAFLESAEIGQVEADRAMRIKILNYGLEILLTDLSQAIRRHK